MTQHRENRWEKTARFCSKTKGNVAFEEVVVDRQPDQVEKLIDTCGSMGVPCTHIVKEDGTEMRILGFDKEKIDEVLFLK